MTVHRTVPVQVWVDVDLGIADLVRELDKIPGIRTHASCQGTIGEGGAEPYHAHVLVSWSHDFARRALDRWLVQELGNNSGYVFRDRDATPIGVVA